MKKYILIFTLTLGVISPSSAQISLPWHEGFEGTNGATYLESTDNITGVPFASFECTDTGRLRTRAGIDFYHSGKAAATLDGDVPSINPFLYQNYLTFTLDLSNYTSKHFDLSFYFSHHDDEPHSSDLVWARGDTSDPWIPIYDWFSNRPTIHPPSPLFSMPAIFKKATVKLSKILSDSSQIVTARTQIMFGHMDDFRAVNPTGNDGLTIDDIELTEVTYNDAAVVSSLNKPICNSNPNITVALKNLGLDTLKNAVINWTINGVSQNSFRYNDTLARGELDTILLGVHNITTVQSMVFWVDSVNNVVDELRYNDTLKIDLAPALNGTYTVAGSTPDFPNLSTALQYARDHGICNSARFEVRQGTFSEHLDFSHIKDTLEVVADPSNTSAVVFQASTSYDTAVATFHDNRLITIDSIHLKALSGSGSVVSLSGINSNLTFTNSIFEGVSTQIDTIPVFHEPFRIDNVSDSILIENNQILNGSIGISASGDYSPDKYWVIRKNHILNWHHRGIEVRGIDDVEIIQNQVKDANNDLSPIGIYIDECPELKLRNNSIEVGGSGNPIGIQTRNCDGQSSDPVFVENNMVAMYSSKTSSATGINILNGSWSRIYHNSVNIISSGKSSRALYINSGSNYNVSNFRVLNNNLCNFGEGYAIFGSSFIGLDTCDYNNLYTKGENVAHWGGTRKTLFDLQLASLQDANSKSANPEFISMTDLHSKSHELDSAALSVLLPNSDLDGDQRNSTFPDIGADEFNLNTNDLKVNNVLVLNQTVCAQNNASIEVSIRNVGSAPQSGFNVFTELSGVSYFHFYNDTLYGGKNDTVRITGINLSATGTYGISAYTALVGDQDLYDDTLRSVDSIKVLVRPNPPQLLNDTICLGDATELVAKNNLLKNRWYLSSRPDSAINVGDTLRLNGIQSTTTFEVESFNYTQESLGDTGARSNGFPYAGSTSGLNFEVLSHEAIIDSVTIFPTGAGWGIVHILDRSGNTIRTSDTIRIVSAAMAKMRVPLGFTLPNGVYTMTLEHSGLTRMGRSLGVSYPLTSPSGAVSILQAVRYGSNTLFDYLYFYDWAVSVPGCPSTRTTVSIDVSGATKPSLNPIGDVCINEPIFTLSGGTPVGGTYLVNGDTTQQFDPSINTPGKYSVTYQFSNQAKCIGDSTVEFYVNHIPSVSLYPFDSICENSNSVSLSGGLPAGGNYLVNGNLNSILDPSKGAGVYRIEYTFVDTNNCSDTAIESFTVNPLPQIALTDTVKVCGSEIATLDPGKHSTYSWVTGDTTRTIDVSFSGDFEVTVTNDFGCLNSATVFVDRKAVCVGINENLSSAGEIRLFPNPSSEDKIGLSIYGANGNVLLNITSLNGKSFYTKSLENTNGIVSEKVDISQLPNGIYIFQLSDIQSTVYRRVNITR